MGIDSYITDPKNHKNAHVITHDDKDSNNGLVVATHPLKKYENSIRYFTSSEYGIDMNIGRTVDYTENINDGTDNSYWTASIISGRKWDIDSTDQNHTGGGTQSIKYDNGDLNDTLQIAKGSDLILTNYQFLIIWIYVDKDWKAGDSIEVYGWDVGAGTMVGNSVGLEDYFSWNIFKVWQRITIPLEDMALTGETLNALRVEIIDEEGKLPKFYMDDIQFEGISNIPGSGNFDITPKLGTWVHVHELSYFLANNTFDSTIDGGVDNITSPTMPYIPYDSFLGVSAASGIVYQRIINGEVAFAAIAQQLSDILQLSGAEIVAHGSAGKTNTWLSVRNTILEPIILKPEDNDILRFSVNDDLSGLDILRISAACKIEYR